MGDALSQQEGSPTETAQPGGAASDGVQVSFEAAAPGGSVPSTSAGNASWQSGGGDQGGQARPFSDLEPVLLAQLVTLLGQRTPRHSLLLSDLGALLPGPLRHSVKEKGGLRSWLQKYPDLFQVTGQPGKESVLLMIGSRSGGAGAASGPASHGPPPAAGRTETPRGDAPQLPARAGGPPNYPKPTASESDDLRKKEEDEENEAAVQLRGLPYRATVIDIKNFLGSHLQNLKDEASVQLVLNRDGRPSGFARVQFNSAVAARAARDDLHMQKMKTQPEEISGASGTNNGAAPAGQNGQERYVEIFLFSERPNKLRFKKTATNDINANSEEEDLSSLGVTKDQVIQECREHMASPGKGQLLLSMLGVALSQGARLYLKKTDQGLKHFLTQFPQEFTVDGAKGRECISFLPALAQGGQNNSDLPAGFHDLQKAQKGAQRRTTAEGTKGPASGSINDLQHGSVTAPWENDALIPQSPKGSEMPAMLGTPKLLATPSDWGTPKPFGQWDHRELIRPGQAATQPQQVQQLGKEGNVASRDMAPGICHDEGSMFGASSGSDALCYGNWSAWAMPPAPYWPPYWMPPGSSGGSQPPPWNLGAAGEDTNRMSQMPWGNEAATSTMGPGESAVAPCMAEMLQAMHMQPATADVAAAAPGPSPETPKMPLPETKITEPISTATVRLRGLPFSSTEQDVFAFFGKHDVVERIRDGSNVVHLITKQNGKPSGQALVQMMCPEDAALAIQVLHGQYIGSRYIEVFPHTEGDGMTAPAANSSTPAAAPGSSLSPGVPGTGAAPQPVASQPSAAQPLAAHHSTSTCPPGHKRPPLTSPFDGASDTGGSGGPSGLGMFPGPWWDSALGGSMLQGAETSGVAVGSAEVAPGAEKEGSWQALFDFLKGDAMDTPPPPVPSAAALSALGTAPDAPQREQKALDAM